MTPESILQTVRATYLRFQSYSDAGTVEMLPPIGKTPIEFKTYFARPAKLAFHWRSWFPFQERSDPPMDSAIWSSGDRSYLSILGNTSQVDSLSLAVAAATGVSSKAVLMIPLLLLPDAFKLKSSWSQMRDLRRLDDEQIDDVHCCHLIGTELTTDDTEVWISEDDQLVRRLRSKTVITTEIDEMLHATSRDALKSFGMSTERFPEKSFGARTYYHQFDYHQITVNDPLPDELFDFDPSAPNP